MRHWKFDIDHGRLRSSKHKKWTPIAIQFERTMLFFIHHYMHVFRCPSTIVLFCVANPYLWHTRQSVVGYGIYSTWFLNRFFVVAPLFPVDAAARILEFKTKPQLPHNVLNSAEHHSDLIAVESDRNMIYPCDQNVPYNQQSFVG